MVRVVGTFVQISIVQDGAGILLSNLAGFLVCMC